VAPAAGPSGVQPQSLHATLRHAANGGFELARFLSNMKRAHNRLLSSGGRSGPAQCTRPPCESPGSRQHSAATAVAWMKRACLQMVCS
jgi:hypothetical protein